MKKIFLFIFLAYSIFFFLIPPFQTPDETGHYDIVYWITRGVYPNVDKGEKPNPHPYNALLWEYFGLGINHPMLIPDYSKLSQSLLEKQSNFPNENKFTPLTSQAYNPPIFYSVAAVFLKITQLFQANLLIQYYAIRLSSALWYFATLFFAFKILRLYFQNKVTQKAALLFFAINPLMLSVGISINPDISIVFFTTLFLHFVVKQKNAASLFSIKNIFFLSLIAGIAALSKISGIFLVPTLVAYLFIQRKTIKQWLWASTLFTMLFVIIQVPWSIFNWYRYHEIVVSEIALGPGSKTFVTNPLIAIISAAWEFRHTFFHFAGFFDWNDTHPSTEIFTVYAICLIVFFCLGIWSVIKSKHQKATIFLLTIFFLFLFFYIFSLDRKLYYPVWDIQGRYILPLFLPMTIFIFEGFNYIFEKFSMNAAKYLSYFSIFYYFFILFFILIPRFYV